MTPHKPAGKKPFRRWTTRTDGEFVYTYYRDPRRRTKQYVHAEAMVELLNRLRITLPRSRKP